MCQRFPVRRDYYLGCTDSFSKRNAKKVATLYGWRSENYF
jgi:hypothetical protein